MGRFRAYPYAKALLAVVQKEVSSRAEEVADELDGVAAALRAVPDFHRVLVTPMVSVEAKTNVLDAVLDSLEIGEPTRRFLHVVQHHYRMQHMTDIATEFRELVDQSLGRTRARVETPIDLDEGSRHRLVSAISAFEGATVVADFEANRDLLGGFKLQVGSRVFDGSLAGELDRLSKEIEIEQG
jgi:F-type H+-transporting ATPase subunit delta